MEVCKNIILTENLTFRIGKTTILNDVNITVPEGIIYGFLGPNGAGKSTLIRILLNLYNNTEGRVMLFGKDVRKERVAILKRVGRFVEHPSLYGHLTGKENVIIAQRYYGVPEENTDEALETVGMREDCHRLVKTYSLGMKQRIAIAQALVHKPELLILDEPTNGLDPSGIREIRDLMIRLNREEGKTVFISSHLLSEIEKLCDHVGVIHHGKILYQGALESLSSHQSQTTEICVNDVSLAQSVLLKQGIKSEHHNNSSISLITNSTWQTASVNRLLVENGIDVYRISQNSHSLEEVFMELTTGV